jgi:osmoprotectant transport system ATP-binding protein
MITLKNLTKHYGELVAVNGISFTVEEGEVCVIIGPSGCGKSTTLKMINRMLEPTSGEVFIGGQNARSMKPELLRRRIGYVIQFVGLFPHMSVAENIGVVPRLLGWDRERVTDRVDELLGLIGLEPATYRVKYPNELSGGEAQRIGVARALAADPPLLLMDEPFGAVDPLNREILQTEFVKIQRELRKTVVFVTHDLDEAIRIADRIVIMREGRIVQYDTPENILALPKNKFVHDFVGSDRALKRLSRFTVDHVMREPISVSLGEGMERKLHGLKGRKGVRYVWVLDGEGRLVGWFNLPLFLEGKSVEEALTRIESSHFTLSRESTLREALARMLGEGVKVVPVVDSGRRLVGEINLQDIEKITEEVEARWNE